MSGVAGVRRLLNEPSAMQSPPNLADSHFKPLVLALSLVLAPASAWAQNVSGDQRFTPVLGEATPLYPQSPGNRRAGVGQKLRGNWATVRNERAPCAVK